MHGYNGGKQIGAKYYGGGSSGGSSSPSVAERSRQGITTSAIDKPAGTLSRTSAETGKVYESVGERKAAGTVSQVERLGEKSIGIGKITPGVYSRAREYIDARDEAARQQAEQAARAKAYGGDIVPIRTQPQTQQPTQVTTNDRRIEFIGGRSMFSSIIPQRQTETGGDNVFVVRPSSNVARDVFVAKPVAREQNLLSSMGRVDGGRDLFGTLRGLGEKVSKTKSAIAVFETGKELKNIGTGLVKGFVTFDKYMVQEGKKFNKLETEALIQKQQENPLPKSIYDIKSPKQFFQLWSGKTSTLSRKELSKIRESPEGQEIIKQSQQRTVETLSDPNVQFALATYGGTATLLAVPSLIIPATAYSGYSTAKSGVEFFQTPTPKKAAETIFLGGTTVLGAGPTVRFVRGIPVRLSKTPVPAEQVFEPKVLRGEQTFPKSPSGEAALASFKQTPKTSEGIPTLHAAPKSLGRDVTIKPGPAGRRLLEDPGLYVSPEGRGSPHFLGTSKGYGISLLPDFNFKLPTLSRIFVKDIKMLPRDVLGAKNFEPTAEFLQTRVGKGEAFITRRSTLRQTSETEAVIPVESQLEFIGTKSYTKVGREVVPIEEFRLARGTKTGKGVKVSEPELVDVNVLRGKGKYFESYYSAPRGSSLYPVLGGSLSLPKFPSLSYSFGSGGRSGSRVSEGDSIVPRPSRPSELSRPSEPTPSGSSVPDGGGDSYFFFNGGGSSLGRYDFSYNYNMITVPPPSVPRVPKGGGGGQDVFSFERSKRKRDVYAPSIIATGLRLTAKRGKFNKELITPFGIRPIEL